MLRVECSKARFNIHVVQMYPQVSLVAFTAADSTVSRSRQMGLFHIKYLHPHKASVR